MRHATEQWGLDRARGYGVDQNVVGCKFQRHSLRHADDSGFGCNIMHQSSAAFKVQLRSDIDDPTTRTGFDAIDESVNPGMVLINASQRRLSRSEPRLASFRGEGRLTGDRTTNDKSLHGVSPFIGGDDFHISQVARHMVFQQ